MRPTGSASAAAIVSTDAASCSAHHASSRMWSSLSSSSSMITVLRLPWQALTPRVRIRVPGKSVEFYTLRGHELLRFQVVTDPVLGVDSWRKHRRNNSCDFHRLRFLSV